VAQAYARPRLKAGDEVLITEMEHHSNIVPWQMVCEQTEAQLRVAPITDAGELSMDHFRGCLNERTRMVALVHVSNALGTVNPVKEIVGLAHARGVPVLVDGAQAAAHLKVDVQDLGCDFYAFSGHKVYGPTGVGVLYGREELLEAMPPYQGGGDMIASVTFQKTLYNHLPYKFEAGTPNVAGVVGLSAALEYLRGFDWPVVEAHERDLLEYGTRRLAEVQGLRMVGTARQKLAILSFVLDDIHPHDIGTILDQRGIAIRTGHHCAQPLMDRFGVPATARASLALYNTRQEIDALVDALHEVSRVFR
jgi:cysteine desulfurase/selenocysteine lyase